MGRIGERIKELRLALNLTQQEFGARIGLSAGAISGIEKGKRGVKKGIGVEIMKRIAQAYQVDLNWLITGRRVIEKVADLRTNYQADREFNPVPILIDLKHRRIIDYVSLPKIPKGCFAIYILDQSMMPRLQKDDIVIINPRIRHLKKGDIGLFKVGAQFLIRYYYFRKGKAILQPGSPEFVSIALKPHNLSILGRVIAKLIYC